MNTQKHTKRINSQLRDAGMTNYGFIKLETSYLPEIIHVDEKIEAVVYGLLSESFDSVMLVATDKRLLFVDCKPIYKNYDEITYEVVAGVNISIVGPFSSIVLHTRVRDFALRYVNIACARNFAKYIEKHIEISSSPLKRTKKKQPQYQPYKIDSETNKKSSHVLDDTAVLSTIDEHNHPHASVIHFVYGQDDTYYFLTKTDTQKARNIASNPQVALTMHPSGSLHVLYIKGTALHVDDKDVHDAIYSTIATAKEYTEGTKFAPIIKIDGGQYIVFKIEPENTKLLDYSTSSW